MEYTLLSNILCGGLNETAETPVPSPISKDPLLTSSLLVGLSTH